MSHRLERLFSLQTVNGIHRQISCRGDFCAGAMRWLWRNLSRLARERQDSEAEAAYRVARTVPLRNVEATMRSISPMLNGLFSQRTPDCSKKLREDGLTVSPVTKMIRC